MTLRIQHVGIQGLGLIGSSVARSLQPHVRITGFDPDPVTRETAIASGVTVVEEPEDLSQCDLVLLAAPTDTNCELLAAEIAAGSGRIVADLGSVKGPIEEIWLKGDSDFPFVGTHPMSGSESSGFAAGSADLFVGAPWPVVVHERTEPTALMTTLEIIKILGGRPIPVSSARHDAEVARVSHLAQVLAGALGRGAAGLADDHVTVNLAGGAYRDGSRVSAGPPDRTAEYLNANGPHAAEAVRVAAAELLEVAGALEVGDATAVEQWLTPAHRLRGAFNTRWETRHTVELTGTGVDVQRLLLDQRDRAVWVTELHQTGDDTWHFALDVAETSG